LTILPPSDSLYKTPPYFSRDPLQTNVNLFTLLYEKQIFFFPPLDRGTPVIFFRLNLVLIPVQIYVQLFISRYSWLFMISQLLKLLIYGTVGLGIMPVVMRPFFGLKHISSVSLTFPSLQQRPPPLDKTVHRVSQRFSSFSMKITLKWILVQYQINTPNIRVYPNIMRFFIPPVLNPPCCNSISDYNNIQWQTIFEYLRSFFTTIK